MTQKEIDRLLNAAVKTEARRRGWKSVGGFAYWVSGPLLVVIVSTASAKLGFFNSSLRFKWLSLDRILWRVLGLSSNEHAPFSLHANGAFVLAGQEVSTFSAKNLEWIPGVLEQQVANSAEVGATRAIEVAQQTSSLASFIQFIDREHQAFMARHPGAAVDIWKERVLAAMETGDLETAKRIAGERIAAGESGSFVSDGRSFYVRALELCSRGA